MTSNKTLVVYYSMTGNTKAIVNELDDDVFDKINITNSTPELELNKYEKIIFATSTWGRGIPPKPFFELRDKLIKIKGKKIGLIGSGRTEFEYFCGAIDLLEQMLEKNNKIIFKFKYEGYPKENEKKYFKELIKKELL